MRFVIEQIWDDMTRTPAEQKHEAIESDDNDGGGMRKKRPGPHKDLQRKCRHHRESVCFSLRAISLGPSSNPVLVVVIIILLSSASASICLRLEIHHRLQTRDLLLVLGVRVRHDRVLALGHLLRDLDLLGQRHVPLLERALEVDVADLLAQVGLLVDQPDQAVLDLEQDLGAVLDVLGEGPVGDDAEGGAAGVATSVISPKAMERQYRNRGFDVCAGEEGLTL